MLDGEFCTKTGPCRRLLTCPIRLLPAPWSSSLTFHHANFPARAAQGIVDAMKAEITQFHALSKGNIESIGLLFSEMAQQPLPPQVICKILGMDEEAVKAAFEKGEPV